MKLDKEQLQKDIETMFEMVERYRNVVWEPQEGQENHFDRLQKAEKVAIIGIFDDAMKLKNSLLSYQRWFEGDR